MTFDQNKPQEDEQRLDPPPRNPVALVAGEETLLDSLTESIVFLDDKLHVRKFNAAIVEVFNLTPQDVGRPLEHIAYHLENQDKMIQTVKDVLRDGKPRTDQVRTRDGKWFIRRIFPFRKADITQGVVLTFNDISEFKAVEERLHLAMNASRLVWWEWDLGNDALKVNTAGACILGYPHIDLIPTGKSWMSLVHPEDRSYVQESLQSCLQGLDPEWNCEHRFRAANGEWLWVIQAGKVTEYDKEGKAARILGITREIHARKTAEKELDRSERFFHTIFNHTDTGIITLDPTGRILELNPAFVKIIGYEPGDLVGKEYLSLVLQQDKTLANQQIADALTKEGPSSIEQKRLITRSGKRIWVHTSTIAIRDDSGRILYLLKQIWDITRIKENEDQSQILREQLFQAQKLESIGTLAGGIAHDFNNILAAIMGFAELASRRLNENEPAQHDLSKVLTAAKRAKSLVNQILTFSRRESGSLQPLDMYLYVREAVDFLRASIPTTIEIKQSLDKNSGLVMADGTQIHQIVVNLCTNAAHAIQRKGNQDGIIEITLTRTHLDEEKIKQFPMLEPGPYLKLSVRDNGTGMDETTSNRIFEPFFTTKAPGEGTGLGLPVVHGIVNQYHGHIAVDSIPGEGTVFSIYLPALEADAPVAATEEKTSDPNEIFVTDTGERILLVDDEKPITLMAKRLLEDSGYRVTAFTDSLKAYQHFEKNPLTYAMVITDQVMPHMTGCELGEAIRKLHPDIPILIITGYGHNLTSERLAAIGGVATLMKPFGAEELVSRVKECLPDGVEDSSHAHPDSPCY